MYIMSTILTIDYSLYHRYIIDYIYDLQLKRGLYHYALFKFIFGPLIQHCWVTSRRKSAANGLKKLKIIKMITIDENYIVKLIRIIQIRNLVAPFVSWALLGHVSGDWIDESVSSFHLNLSQGRKFRLFDFERLEEVWSGSTGASRFKGLYNLS